MLDRERAEYIYNQLTDVYSEDDSKEILHKFEQLYNANSLLSMDIIEVIEEVAELNHNTEKLPYWLYDVVPYNDFCDYLESLEVVEVGEDFIKFDDNVYYQITDIVNSIC
jgi:hypothetical protein